MHIRIKNFYISLKSFTQICLSAYKAAHDQFNITGGLLLFYITKKHNTPYKCCFQASKDIKKYHYKKKKIRNINYTDTKCI